jgi:hypothetical protein
MKNPTPWKMRRIQRTTDSRTSHQGCMAHHHQGCMVLLAGVGTVVGRMTANRSTAVWSNDLVARSVIVRDDRSAIMDEAVLR